MIANVKLIEAVLKKYSVYKIGKETGISYSTVNDWKKGITSIYINVNLKVYKSGNLKMYNFTHSIHPSIGRIHP